jgi:hypothetical protein
MSPGVSRCASAILRLMEVSAGGAPLRTKPPGAEVIASCTTMLRAWGFANAREKRAERTNNLETILSGKW